jgi:hypothetical protein
MSAEASTENIEDGFTRFAYNAVSEYYTESWVSALDDIPAWWQVTVYDYALTSVRVESVDNRYPAKYQIQISEQNAEPFTWITVATVLQSSMVKWTDIDYSEQAYVYAKRVRILCEEKNVGANAFSINLVELYGFTHYGSGTTYDYQYRHLETTDEGGQSETTLSLNENLEEVQADHAAGPIEEPEEHRRLLEEPKDDRRLQAIVIAGYGVASLKFPGRRSLLRANEDQRRDQAGSEFSLDLTVFAYFPSETASSATAIFRLGMWGLAFLSLAACTLLWELV